MLFRATQRVRDWLKEQDESLSTDGETHSFTDKEWYCHMVVLHRRKCLLFTHSASLFSFLIAGVRQQTAAGFGRLFRANASSALTADGVTGTQIEYLIDSGPDRIVKTDNRAVLGSMNDLIRMWKLYAEGVQTLDELRVAEINCEFNEIPMSYIGMQGGAERLKEYLQSINIR